MSVESAERWSTTGLIVGGALFLAELVGDLCVWLINRQPVVPLPFHTLIVVVTITSALSGVILRVYAWLARLLPKAAATQPEPERGRPLSENTVEIVRRMARTQVEDKPAPSAPDALPPDNVRAFELGRDIERANGHRH